LESQAHAEGGDEEQFDDPALEVERLKTTVSMM